MRRNDCGLSTKNIKGDGTKCHAQPARLKPSPAHTSAPTLSHTRALPHTCTHNEGVAPHEKLEVKSAKVLVARYDDLPRTKEAGVVEMSATNEWVVDPPTAKTLPQ